MPGAACRTFLTLFQVLSHDRPASYKAGMRVTTRATSLLVAFLAGEGSQYMVALSDRIVTAPEASLAPDLEEGDMVLFGPQRGEVAEVNISSIDASMWYAVCCYSCSANLLN